MSENELINLNRDSIEISWHKYKKVMKPYKIGILRKIVKILMGKSLYYEENVLVKEIIGVRASNDEISTFIQLMDTNNKNFIQYFIMRLMAGFDDDYVQDLKIKRIEDNRNLLNILVPFDSTSIN